MRTPIFLSRLPIHSDKPNKEVDEVRLINLLQIESLPMNVDQVRKATRMMTVWPDKQITLYFSKRHEIQSEMVVYCTSKRFDLFLKVNGRYQLICQERRKLEPTLD